MAVDYNAKPLLTVEGLKQYFKVSKSFTVHAVENVSFKIYPGETYGLVGESGSGKSTIGRSIIRLYDPTAGSIRFGDTEIGGKLSAHDNHMLRTQMQMIFQDPMASLNPRKKIGDIIGEGLDIHHMYLNRAERAEKIQDILAKVVNLMKDIQQETGTAYLFIAHDLSMVKYISDRIGVLHLGHLLETGTTEEIFSNPVHPYTRSLLSAIPAPNPIVEKQRVAENYDYKTSGINYDQGTDHLVSGSHYVKCTDEEFAKWTKRAI